MMIKVAGPGGGMVHPLYLEDRKNKLPKWAWAAIGVSVGLHVVGGGYLLYQKIAVPEPVIVDAPPPTITIIDKVAPPQTPEHHADPKPPAAVHQTPPPIDLTQDVAPFPSQPDATPVKGAEVSPTVVDRPATDAGTAPPANVDAGPKVITKPQWVKRPTPEQMARYYPPSALARGVEGAATLKCSVTVSGAVTACQVLSENPRGEDFGKAAQRLSRFFVMSPQTVDGRPVEGGQVTFTVKFTLS